MLPIYPRAIDVSALPGYRLDVGFADGTRGIVNCAHLILRDDPGLFGTLRDHSEFAKAYVSADVDTVAWPNGLDLDPDVLYARAHSIPIPDE